MLRNRGYGASIHKLGEGIGFAWRGEFLMTTVLILLFFVAYVSPVFFCAGLEKFAKAPVDKTQGNEKFDEKFLGSQFPSQARRSVLSLSR